MNNNLTLEWSLDDGVRRNRSQQAVTSPPAVIGKLPRVARLMALAIKFEGMLQEGVAADYADLARLGLVTRARMTQIMNLLNLAPTSRRKSCSLLSGRRGGRRSPNATSAR